MDNPESHWIGKSKINPCGPRGWQWQNPPNRLAVKEVASAPIGEFSMLSIIPFTSGMMTGVLSYVGYLFDDLKLLILLIFAVGLGLWIVERVITALRHEKE